MIEIIKKFNLLLDKKQKNKLLILGVITLGGAFLEVLGVSLMLPMVTAIMQPDIIYTNSFISKVCNAFGLSSHRSFVLLCIIALIIVFLVKNLYLILEYYIQARFVYNNRFNTQKHLLHAYMLRPYDYYLNADSGEIMRNINGDVQEVYSLLMSLLRFATELIVSIALMITVFVVEPTMTVCIVIMMAVIILIISKIVKPILAKKGKEFRENYASSYRWLLQSVQGMKEVKVSNCESFFETNFEKSGMKTIAAEKWQSVLGSTPRMLIEAGCVCATLAIIAVMIYGGKPLESLFPALAAFAMAAMKLMPSANYIVNTINEVAFHGPAVDKLLNNLNILDETPTDKYQSKHSLTLKDKIELKDIVYSYPNTNINVLNGASMTIPVGTSVGITGKSGAGKTTAVDVMLGLLKPKEGSVTTDGVDIMSDYPDWLSHLGYIPQSIFILNDTIRGNVAFGSESDDDKVWKALEEAHLADFVRSLPKQLDTNIGERGVKLSGGQRQRIGIARVLYNDPELLVFDEATSSLDNETEEAIMESINGLHGKKTMVIIAHRLQTIEGCDIVYNIQDGKIYKQ